MNVSVSHLISDKRTQVIVGTLAVVAIAGLGWFLYASYRDRINEQAQFAFAMQLENIERLRADAAADKQAWESAERDFAQSYQEHSSSDLAPFYLALQAETAWHAQKEPEAVGLLEKAVSLMGEANPLYYLYKTKLQIMRLASGDAAVREEGQRELKALAQDVHNPNRGYAWYQIWHHAWVAGDQEAAQEALTKLAAQQSQGAQWSKLAQAKMEFSA